MDIFEEQIEDQPIEERIENQTNALQPHSHEREDPVALGGPKYQEFIRNQQEETFSALSETTNTMTPLDFDTVAKKLDGNTDRLFLKDLRNKSVYLTVNGCVDGREDAPGISSFGGAAGNLGAQYLALKKLFGETLSEVQILDLQKQLIGDVKFYLHDDTKTVDTNHGKHPCDCKHIGCGAVQRMLSDKTLDANGVNPWGFSTEDRDLYRQFLKEHANIKVLDDAHLEESIIWIKNNTRKDQVTGDEYIDILKKNKKELGDATKMQDFGYHETGRNIVLDYMCADMAEVIMQKVDHELLKKLIYDGGDHNIYANAKNNLCETLHYLLKASTMEIADTHTLLTAEDLPPAKALLDAKKVVYIEKISHKGNHKIIEE